MSSQQQFEDLLRKMMSEDNKVRKQAEAVFNKTRKSQPSPILQALLQVARSAQDAGLRAFAVVVLRRSLIDGDKSMWPKLNAQTQALIKRELLLGIEQDPEALVRSNLREAAFEVASDLFEEGKPWNELIDWLLKIAQSAEPHHRESAVSLLGQLSMYMVDAFNKPETFKIVRDLLAAGLNDKGNLQVRLASLMAATNVIQVFTDPEPRNLLRDLTPLMLDTCAEALNEDAHAEAEQALKLFIELVDLDSNFIKPNAPAVMEAMMRIAGADSLEDGLRQLAVEFIVSFTENKPQISKDIPGFAKNIIEILLQMLMEVEDVSAEEWNATLMSSDRGDEAALDILNNDVAQEALDRLATALEGDAVVPVIFEHVPQLLQSQDWKARHVALMAMSMIFEGCTDVLFQHLEKLLSLVLPSLADQHPRVRWAAVNALGQMSTDFGPKLQRQFHKDIAPRLAAVFDDVNNIKVVAHACAATINFVEKAESTTLEQYLPLFLGKLHQTLQINHVTVQEQSVTAVAAIAGSAGRVFEPFYNNFMPSLKEMMVRVTDKEHRMLRCKVIECISLIGVAVGKDRFLPDAPKIMEHIAGIQTGYLDADDPTREFVLQAWTRIASTLGDAFVPYLSFVMPPVFESAKAEAGVHIVSADEFDDEEDAEEGWEILDVGDKKIIIHTSALEEKATACNMLFCYASEMKAAFMPYVETTTAVIVPLLNYFYHDGVRMSCMSAVPHLINAVKLARKAQNQDDAPARELFAYLFPKLMHAVREEEDLEVTVVGLECIHETLSVIGSNVLTGEQVKELTRQVKAFFLASQKRRQTVLKNNPEEEEEDASRNVKKSISQEDDILHELSEIVGVLVREHPPLFLAAYEELHPLVLDMLKPQSPRAERQLAVCIFDDIVEHTREHSHSLFPIFVPAMLRYALDPHRGLRQACTYGFGVCAQHGPDAFNQYVPEVLDVLVKVINMPNSREGLNAPPAENAISSFAKIILHRPHLVQDRIPSMIDMFVNWLPVEVDKVEAKIVHAFLLGFLKTHSEAVFGANYKNLPQLLTVFARVLETDLIHQETAAEIYGFLQQMQTAMPADMLKAAFGAISEDHQIKLQRKPNVAASPAKKE